MTATLLVVAALGCRFMPNHPYWIETLGRPQGIRIGAWPGGALAIGTDSRLYGYPGPWSRPWAPQGHPQEIKALSASQTAVYAILSDGQVARFANDRWTPFAGSAAWGAAEIAATEDDHLLVLAGGKLRRADAAGLKEVLCETVVGVSIAATRGDEAYVVDQAGEVHRSAARNCAPVEAPARFLRIAATTTRLLGVARDGSVWRQRAGRWTALPSPFKYRPGTAPTPTRAQDIAVSAQNTWLMDHEGSIFVLSDET